MKHPETGKPFAQQIADDFAAVSYSTMFNFLKVSQYGVPQTRRRFILIAHRDSSLKFFNFPKPETEMSVRDFIFDLGQDDSVQIPNHNPKWGFKSYAHTETGSGEEFSGIALPVRLSRTASDGHPVRDFDSPFPAIDTATVWGWAAGDIAAERIDKDRCNGMFIRNPDATARLWRISAKRIRAFTAREYARIQTFPDDWVFSGSNKRELQLQIGNAVPVIFAKKIALKVRQALEAADGKRKIAFEAGEQLRLF